MTTDDKTCDENDARVYCICDAPGFCERHGITKGTGLWRMCQRKSEEPYRSSRDHFDLWEDGVGVKQRPSPEQMQAANEKAVREEAQRFKSEQQGGPPSVAQKAWSFTKAIAQFTSDGFKTVSEDQYRTRMAICDQCEHRKGNACSLCGCNLSAKAKMPKQSCPARKWPDIEGERESDGAVSVPQSSKRSEARWSVGVTTAPRGKPTLNRCLASLVRTGFSDINLFAEPNSQLTEFAQSFRVFHRRQRLGCYHNYVQALRDMLADDPDATHLLMVQDDVVFARNVRLLLERDLWPSANTGVVSLYAANYPGYEKAAKFSGWKQIKQRNLMGACAMAYPRRAAEKLVAYAERKPWKGRVKGRAKTEESKAAVDAFVGRTMHALGLDVFFIIPSLCQHFAQVSSIKHGPATGKRKSARFPGEGTDATTFFPASLIRYELPSGEAVAYHPKPEPTDEPIAVVIPAHECRDLTLKCLRHLVKNGGHPLEVIYVDNGSSDATVDIVKKYASNNDLALEVIRNDTNEGFTTAINQGMRVARSRGRHTLLLNNDCWVTRGCIPAMFKHLRWHDRVAAVNPTPLHTPNRENVAERSVLPFYCTMLHRDAVEDIGLLSTADEFSAGLGADDEWCIRARRSGWRLLLCHDAKAKHEHKASFKRLGINRRKLQRIAAGKLKEMRQKT